MARKYTEYCPEGIEGVVEISRGDFYVKTPDSLDSLRVHLRKIGYNVRDVSRGSKYDKKPAREVQEKEGWALWFGTLGKRSFKQKGECGSCKSLIELRGIRSHNHKCEECGKPTYLEYVDGGEISFSVVDDTAHSFRDLTFVINGYDKDKQLLGCYVRPQDCKNRRDRRMRNFYRTPEKCEELVPELAAKFPETFKVEKIDGVKILLINHKDDCMVHEHGINTARLEGDIVNYHSVKIFRGKKFNEFDDLAVPETVSIHEAWHYLPLSPGPDLYKRIMSAARQVSRKDYYHQDGSAAFNNVQINWMLKFIENFTTIDVEKIRPYLTEDLSGPAMIDTLAELTGHNADIPTEPNVGNALTFFGKLMSGRSVDQHEFREAWKGTYQDKNGKVIRDVLGEEKVSDTFSLGADILGLNGNPQN